MRHNKFALFGSGLYYAYPKAWSPYNKGIYITLTADNLHAVCTSQSMCIGTPELAINPGDYKFFEVHISSMPAGSLAIGIATSSADFSHNLGDDLYSWGYYTFGGVSKKIGNGSAASYGTPFAPLDVIGVGVNYTATGGTTCELEFFYDGVSQGIAFTGITGTLYPAIGSILSGSFSVDGNFIGPTSVPAFTIPAGSSFF